MWQTFMASRHNCCYYLMAIHRRTLVWATSGLDKNWTYKGDELTSMHFTVVINHLGLFWPSNFELTSRIELTSMAHTSVCTLFNKFRVQRQYLALITFQHYQHPWPFLELVESYGASMHRIGTWSTKRDVSIVSSMWESSLSWQVEAMTTLRYLSTGWVGAAQV